MEIQRFILKKELPQYCGLRRTQIEAKIERGEFPKPVRLSERRLAWLERDIAAWQAEQIKRGESKCPDPAEANRAYKAKIEADRRKAKRAVKAAGK